MDHPDLVLFHAQITPCDDPEERMGEIGRLRTISDGALVVRRGEVARVGETDEVLAQTTLGPETVLRDVRGHAVVPGFTDPHTHMIHAGRRIAEMAMRQAGREYLDILRAGGGIQETVRRTSEAEDDDLVRATRRRIAQAIAYGTTSIEVKTGYGLTPERELRLLRLLERVRRHAPIEIRRTFLGLHAWPEGVADPQDHLGAMDAMLAQVAERGLAEMADVFCEEGVFSVPETRRHLEAARAAGLGLRLHADEIHPIGGAELAAKLQALSADHLLAASDAGLRALAESGTIAVNLPGTAFFLHRPPLGAERQRAAGVRAALATDHNPGSSPTLSMPMVISLAVHQSGFTPDEALFAATRGAAAAIGIAERCGRLGPGTSADFLVLDDPDFRVLAYSFGLNPVREAYAKGRPVARNGVPTEEVEAWTAS